MASQLSSAGNFPLISRSAARTAFTQAILLFVGDRFRKRRYTMAQVQTALGWDEKTIKAVERATYDADSDDYRNPPIHAIIGLCTFLGTDFTNEWLRLAGQGAFELMEGQIPLPKVLATAESNEKPEDERKRLIRRLAELEDAL